ncbi:MAG: eCIS core domain-containing protein, partial [Acidimicrobiales bacterium]
KNAIHSGTHGAIGQAEEPTRTGIAPSVVSNRALGELARSQRGAGQPLAPAVRANIEQLAGGNLGAVRIHEGTAAQRIVESVDARAATLGSDVFMGAGAYKPHTLAGHALLRHESVHTLQASRSGAARSGEVAVSSPRDSTERDARRGFAGARCATPQMLHRFGTAEHLSLGDAATAMTPANQVELSPDYYISFGDMVAMAGDFFASLGQMRRLAANEGTGAGTREEIEYVRTVKVRKTKSKTDFSDAAVEAADTRYLTLAGSNQSHFVRPHGETIDPMSGDTALPQGSGIAFSEVSTILQTCGLPREAPSLEGSPRFYRYYHVAALRDAVYAGAAGRSVDAAMAAEAFAGHYLTDAFAAGHVRTPRLAVREHWNEIVPMFGHNVSGWIAQEVSRGIAQELSFSAGPLGSFSVREDVLFGGVGFDAPMLGNGVLDTVTTTFAAKGITFTFGDVVSAALHDLDNHEGIDAMIQRGPGLASVSLFGDGNLGSGDEQRLAIEAIQKGVAEVNRAHAMGRSGAEAMDVVLTLAGTGLFDAEVMIPNTAPEEAPQIWDFANVDDLLKSESFQEGLAIFGREQQSTLTEQAADLPEMARGPFESRVAEPFGSDPIGTLQRILAWVPDTGGGMFGHNTDDNASDYIDQARATEGGLESLTVDQRKQLVRDLIDGATVGEDEDQIMRVLRTASSADARTVIQSIGWSKMHSDIDDWVGEEFAEEFPEEQYAR